MELQSADVAKLAAALAKAAGKLNHAAKNATNPHYGSNFANLESVIDATRGTLAEHGLVVVQAVLPTPEGLLLATTLLHESGQWLRSFAPVFNEKKNAQGMGIGLTYARRYSLAAICGISQEDSDGEPAREDPRPRSTKPVAGKGTLVGNSGAQPSGPKPKAAPDTGKALRAMLMDYAAKNNWTAQEIGEVIREHFNRENADALTPGEIDDLTGMIRTQSATNILKVVRARKDAQERRVSARHAARPSSDFINQPEPAWDNVPFPGSETEGK